MTGAGFLGSYSRRQGGGESSPSPRYTKNKAWWFFFFFSICPGISLRVLAQRSWPSVGVGMWMEAPGTCVAESLPPSDPDQTTETTTQFLQLWNERNSPSSFSSLLRDVVRKLTLQVEDLTVLFCKMQDFSSLNILTIVYKVIVPSILASSSRLFFVLFVFYVGVFFLHLIA